MLWFNHSIYPFQSLVQPHALGLIKNTNTLAPNSQIKIRNQIPAIGATLIADKLAHVEAGCAPTVASAQDRTEAAGAATSELCASALPTSDSWILVKS